MSFDFSKDDECFVNIAKKVVTTDPWGSETAVVNTRMTLTEVNARDTNKQAGKEVIKIINIPDVPQIR